MEHYRQRHGIRPLWILTLIVIALVSLFAAVNIDAAQQTINEPITGARVLVLPATGDPATVAPIATQDTFISATAPMCNQPQAPASTAPLENPRFVVFDDPFNAARTCRVSLPPTLPEGQYRAVVQFLTMAATCSIMVNGQSTAVTPCTSLRSEVGVPPFSIVNIRRGPAAPTGVLIIR